MINEPRASDRAAMGDAALPPLPPRSCRVAVAAACFPIDSISLLISLSICPLLLTTLGRHDVLISCPSEGAAATLLSLLTGLCSPSPGSMDPFGFTQRADTWWGVPGGMSEKLVVLVPSCWSACSVMKKFKAWVLLQLSSYSSIFRPG